MHFIKVFILIIVLSLSVSRYSYSSNHPSNILTAHQAYLNDNFSLLSDSLEKLRKAGDPRAAYMLGYLYYRGEKGMSKDLDRAIELFKESAERGHEDAKNALGVIYKNTSKEIAVEYFLQAADQGSLTALTNLVDLLIAEPRLVANAPEIYRIAAREANAGSPSAMVSLGQLHETRIAVSNPSRSFYHYKSARHWYEKAIMQNNAAAMYHLAGGFIRGDFVEQNFREANNLLQRAAKLGLPEAQFQFGVSLADGRGIPIDRKRAIKFVCQASAQGLAQAQRALQHIGMTPQDCHENTGKREEKWHPKAELIGSSSTIADDLTKLLKISLIAYGAYKALDSFSSRDDKASYDFSRTEGMSSDELGFELLRQKSKKGISGRGILPTNPSQKVSIGYRGDYWDGYLQTSSDSSACRYWSQGQVVSVSRVSTEANCPLRVDIPGFNSDAVFDYERFMGNGYELLGNLDRTQNQDSRYCVYVSAAYGPIRFPRGEGATCPETL